MSTDQCKEMLAANQERDYWFSQWRIAVVAFGAALAVAGIEAVVIIGLMYRGH